MKVGITGASGFVGQHLLKACLNLGYDVTVLTRNRDRLLLNTDDISVVIGDLTQPLSLYEFTNELDVLYHCAGEITDELKMHAIHIDGMSNLMEAAKNRIKHWVQLSSVGVYGDVQSGVVTEDSPINPAGEYEITKCHSDDILIKNANSYGFTYSILRPANIFGSGMKNQSLFDFISMLDKKLFFYIGNNKSYSNYIHVSNVVNALLLCGVESKSKNRIFNLSDCRSMEECVEIISNALNKPYPVFRLHESIARFIAKTLGKFPSFPLTLSRVNALTKQSIYPIHRIQQELNYEHSMSTPEGLRMLVMEWKKRKDL